MLHLPRKQRGMVCPPAWRRGAALLLLAVSGAIAANVGDAHHVTAVRFWSLGAVTRIAIQTDGGLVRSTVFDQGKMVRVEMGKVSFASEKLLENANTLLNAVVKAKPAAAKGKYVRSVTICSTMGPGISLDTTPYNQKAV